MIAQITDFFQSPFGTIIIRLICVLAIGVGIHAIAIVSSGQKIVSKRVHLVGYLLNIFMSIIISYRYDRHELSTIDYVIEGILYGAGAVGVQAIITSPKFLEFLKVWKKK